MKTSLSEFLIQGAAVDDAPKHSDIVLFIHHVVPSGTAQFPRLGLGEASLGENHVVILVDLQAVSPAQLAGEGRVVQTKQLSQPTQREAAVAAAESVAVDQQQVAAACGHVPVEGAAL